MTDDESHVILSAPPTQPSSSLTNLPEHVSHPKYLFKRLVIGIQASIFLKIMH